MPPKYLPQGRKRRGKGTASVSKSDQTCYLEGRYEGQSTDESGLSGISFSAYFEKAFDPIEHFLFFQLFIPLDLDQNSFSGKELF